MQDDELEQQAGEMPRTEIVMEEPEIVEEPPKDELADLFEVPQPEDNDMTISHLFEVPEEEDLSDLVDVGNEDLMGYGGEPPAAKTFRITPKGRRIIRYRPPLTPGDSGMQGVR